MIELQEVKYQRTEWEVANEKFFPVHMNNEELQIIINEIFERISPVEERIIKIFVRTDKGGKGIDFKLEENWRRPNQIVKVRQHSLGLNANWKLVDFFEHYTQPSRGTTKIVAGKEYYYPKYVANEIIGYQSEEVEGIYQKRLKNPQKPVRNPLFEHDNWTCIMEQNNHLASE